MHPGEAAHLPFYIQPSSDEARAKQENHFPIKLQSGDLSHGQKGLRQTPLPGGQSLLGMFIQGSPVLGWLSFMYQVL